MIWTSSHMPSAVGGILSQLGLWRLAVPDSPPASVILTSSSVPSMEPPYQNWPLSLACPAYPLLRVRHGSSWKSELSAAGGVCPLPRSWSLDQLFTWHPDHITLCGTNALFLFYEYGGPILLKLPFPLMWILKLIRMQIPEDLPSLW